MGQMHSLIRPVMAFEWSQNGKYSQEPLSTWSMDINLIFNALSFDSMSEESSAFSEMDTTFQLMPTE